MTNEEKNTALYEKIFAEQETYRKWLLDQPPEEILKHSYEYTVREDFRNLNSGKPTIWIMSLIPWSAGRMPL